MKKARGPMIETVWDHIAWFYANLARADAALSEGCLKYKRHHHIIRSKLFSGLRTGKMSMRSLYDDERLKMTFPQACCYCGSTEGLSLDHLIPRFRGGEDEGDNLVWASRRCNSSKGSADLLYRTLNSSQKRRPPTINSAEIKPSESTPSSKTPNPKARATFLTSRAGRFRSDYSDYFVFLENPSGVFV